MANCAPRAAPCLRGVQFPHFMSIPPGTRLGPYEVTGALGAGGMGEVYRARDTQLDRNVAIKLLPDAFAQNADRLARFQREAKTLASLNHPNIAIIYGLEHGPAEAGHHRVAALVMELVEGEDLSERLTRGAIAIDEALPIAKQIAEALEAAHDQGVVHRDLKPANIKLRRDGTVKVLDFGLAKLAANAESNDLDAGNAPSISPTMTSPAMTRAGIILGTAAYMSPEQAKGRVVDRRADIWAFGAVLFEMLTGQRAFPGEDVTDTLAAVVRGEPEWSLLPREVSPTLVVFLKRCLRKDPKQRMGDIRDVRLALEGAFETPAPQTAAPATEAGPRQRLPWMIAAAAVLAAATLAVLSFMRADSVPVEQPHLHLSVSLPPGSAPGFFALSPDGRSVVMSYQGGLGIRSLESGDTRVLTGTQNARTPFWSADSRTIAFFADRKLKTAPAAGGPPQILCDNVGLGAGGTWNRAGVIVFSTEAKALTRVSTISGAGDGCTALIKPETDKGGIARAIPVFLPDGDHFLYSLGTPDASRGGLYVGSLADPSGRRLLADPSSGVFVPNGSGSNQGHLLFVREQVLMAQPFDSTSLQLSGDPVKVADQVSFTYTPPQIAVSADTNGTLMYLANGRPEQQLVWYDRSHKELGRAATIGTQGGVSLERGGRLVTFLRDDAQGLLSLWLRDLDRNQETPLTKPPFRASAAVWSPNGQRIAFSTGGAGPSAIVIKNVNGGKEEILLQGGSNRRSPSDWSRDDHWLVYTEVDPKTGADIWRLSDPSTPSVDRKPVALVQTPAVESQGQISPDGKWLAYYSDESGTGQVYIRPFAGGSPVPDTRWQVSTAQGREPRWRGDGKELFYLEIVPGTSRYRLMSASIGAAPNPAGTPSLLFEFESGGFVPQSSYLLYSPSTDGQRFLINVYATEAQPSLEVLLNWGRRR
ncbi:MAG TPA: protein kinase [Vicinamibacterales bacterium]|nr:protein kinase [Vicinamibacterales bacterium]